MRLAKLEIENFRGIKNASIKFTEHQVLLGQNNSGKSTVVDAIGLLLGRDRLARNLGDYDFFGGSPQASDRILITGILIGFSNDNPSSAPEWFNNNNGGVPIWYNEKTGEEHSGNQPANTTLGIKIAFSARFDSEELEFDTIRYFYTGSTDPFEDTGVNLVKSYYHLKELGFYLVPAKRTWDRTMTFNSELFKRVLKFQEAVPGDTIVKLRDELRSNQNRIEEESPLKDIVERLNSELSSFVTAQDSKLTFLPTKGDIEGVLDALTPFIEGQDNHLIPIGKHGSGLISLQTLLLLLEFGRFRNSTGKNFFLCAEEPELHLQPGLHRRLVGRIRGLGNQTIITSHSPEIASYYKPEEILVLRNIDGVLQALPLLDNSLDTGETNAITRLYTIHRKDICEALMNKKVIVPEGLTDYRWLKLLINVGITAEGWEVYEGTEDRTMSFGIVPTQDAKVVETYEKFKTAFSQIVPLVDGDSAGDGYATNLKAQVPPPKIILRLGDGKMLEDLIEWIIQPSESGRQTELEEIESFEGQSFREMLTKLKQHYGYHEALADFILSQEDCVRRARMYINSIHKVKNNLEEFDSMWTKNETLSSDSTFVFDFQYP